MNKYEKSQSAFALVEECVYWQGHCIDHRAYEMMTSVETVNIINLVLSTCLSL